MIAERTGPGTMTMMPMAVGGMCVGLIAMGAYMLYARLTEGRRVQ